MLTLCLQIPYRRSMRSLFADTYELYVRIINAVDRQIRDALNWNTPNWRVLNACHACCYKVRKYGIYVKTRPQLVHF